MAKKSLRLKATRTPKFKVRTYNRCPICGRPRAYLRKFGICRICFRNMASLGKLPGVIKSSWEKRGAGAPALAPIPSVSGNGRSAFGTEENDMAINDPVADMLTRIRNAAKAKFSSVDIPGSQLKVELARLLKDEGFIKNYKFLKDGKQGILRVYLKYGPGQTQTIQHMKRVSKPGRRFYVKSKDLKPVLNGMGISILSTSRGVMTDKQARKENVGGEILCTVS